MTTQATLHSGSFGTNDVQIMAGSFDDISFDDVIQVLSLSRQCLRLLVRQGEAAFSEVLLKAGQVLDARTPTSTDPADVFQTLGGQAVQGSGLSFAVYHTQPTGPFPSPRGRLADLYALVRRAGSTQPVAARSAAVAGAGEPTIRIPPPVARPAASRPLATAAPTPASTATPRTLTLPVDAADTLSKAVLADLQPLLRNELNQVGTQVREQAQALATLEGRLQSLPQLVAAEVRLALAQQERSAPSAPPGVSQPIVTAMAVMLVALVGAVVVLGFLALR